MYKHHKHYYILTLSIFAFFLTPLLVAAQDFVPLVGIPGVDEGEDNISGYIEQLFVLAIGIAAALAVIKIILGGVNYMFSEVVDAKSKAKKDIGGALLGLVIILGSVTILNEINPDLRNFNVLDNAGPVQGGGSNSGGQEGGQEGFDDIVSPTDSKSVADFKAECDEMNGEFITRAQGPAGDQRVICDTPNQTESADGSAQEGDAITSADIVDSDDTDKIRDLLDECNERNGEPDAKPLAGTAMPGDEKTRVVCYE